VTIDINHLYDNRCDPDVRAVLEDWERSRYRTSTIARLGFALAFMDADDADAVGDVAADAVAAAAGASADAAADDADGDGGADAAADDADDGDDAAADDADGGDGADAADDVADDDVVDIRAINSRFSEEPDMSPGLKIVQIAITYYRAITFVGWLKRVSGDEYVLVSPRIITRKSGQEWSWNGMRELAANGPGKKYQLSDKDDADPEELHRLMIKRSIPADEKVWEKHCPKPADWKDES
jgi:hypothetical protein